MGFVSRVSYWKVRFWVKMTENLMCSLTPGSSSDLCYITNEQPEQRFLSAIFRSHGFKIKANCK